MASLAMAVLLWFGGGALADGVSQEPTRPPAAQSQKPAAKQDPDKKPPAADSAVQLERFGVRIVSPTQSDQVAGRISVRAEVAADRPAAVAAVDFFIDGRLLFSDAEAPYELLWNSGRPAEHLIEVIAYGPGRQMVSAAMRTGFSAPESALAGYSARVERVEMHVSIDQDDDLAPLTGAPEFVVLENGVEQDVLAVERVAELPLAVGLLIDHSESMFERLETALEAAGSFVEGLLSHPNDKAFVLGFADIPIVFQEFTNDTDRLAESISLIDDGDYTALYDSIVAASRRFEGIDGRRAVILLTDGADSGSDAGLRQALEAAQRADVVLYPVAVDLSVRHNRERWVLRELAEETGGRVFSLGRRTDPVEIYEAIQDDLRGQFRVSYTPIVSGGDGEWREIEIRLRADSRERRSVRTRPGYFAR